MRKPRSSQASVESLTAWRSQSSWRPDASKSYGLRQTAALLDQRLTLLWVGSRTAPPRQKTLQATLDWSFGLLTELERAVLRRLAAFVGHFTLDAALEVVTSATLDRSTVFSAMDSLVAKSIVATRPIGAMMRYRLLDTMRAYVLDIKIDDAESADLAVRHAAYYRRWLEQSGIEWSSLATGEERVPHFAAINNVRAALEWCFGAKWKCRDRRRTRRRRRSGLLGDVFASGMSSLVRSERCSHSTTRLAAGPTRCICRRASGISSMYTMGNNEQSHAALMRGLELAEKLRDPVNQFRLIGQLNSFHRRAGNFDRMLAVAQRSEAIAKEMARSNRDRRRAFDAWRLASFDRKSGRGPRSLGGGARASARVQLRQRPPL